MEREIKFRGKKIEDGKRTGEWVEGYYAVKGKDTGIENHCIAVSTLNIHVGELAYPFYFTDILVDPSTVCQYTGLKDAKGKEIYENDIVGIWNNRTSKYECHIVKYGEFNCSCCYGVYGWIFDGGDIREYDTYEVIGNVFDDKELLGGD